MRTPAQHYGHPRFADDYPWDGGYGEGERRSACRNAANITAKRPGGECSGILPSWITNYPSGMLSGISLNGRPIPGFGIGQAPDVFATLTPAQQSWVQTTLSTLNSKILAASKPCATWSDPIVSLAAAVGCFQTWANSLQVPLSPGGALRTDGVVDQATLTALLALATQIHPEDFPTPFPATPATAPVQAAAQAAGAAAVAVSPTPVAAQPLTPAGKPVERHKGLSTGAKVGIGVGVAGALGGIVYAVTRGMGGKKSKRRRR
jgi:hypothetical protein